MSIPRFTNKIPSQMGLSIHLSLGNEAATVSRMNLGFPHEQMVRRTVCFGV